MSSPQMVKDDAAPTAATVDLKLEVVVIPVSDVDRSKRFYEGLGWRLDGDFTNGPDWRGVQMTPPGSPCSIHFGKGITAAEPGSIRNLYLVVSDIDGGSRRAHRPWRRRERAVPLHQHRGRAACPGATPRAAPTTPMPRSAIPTATAGCSRRSRRGCPAAASAAWTSRR